MAFQVISPFDQTIVAELEGDDSGAIEAKLERARAALEPWQARSVAERVAAVATALERFRADGESIAAEVSRQMGKPIREARAELRTMLERADHMLSIAPESLAPQRLPERPGFERRIEHAPLGVILNIAAWNYPLLIPINVVVPALVAGNSVLIKHAPETLLTGRRFTACFAELGEGLVQDLIIDHAQAAGVIRDPRVSYVAFTGSVRGGLQVYHTASERVVGVGLELGGKDPAYVAADADLDLAVAGIVDGACYNAGQSCCAVERAYVHTDLYDDFVEAAAAALQGYRLGDPADETTTMGPLARRAAPRFLQRQVQAAVVRGAELRCGGSPTGEPGSFFLPTLVIDVPPEASLMVEESFGPILPLARVSGDAEALELMNRSDLGLTASIWTRDRERAEAMAPRLQTGTVFQNRCDYLDPALAWSGAKSSGLGVTLSSYGYLALTRRKSIHFRSATGAMQ